MRLVNNAIIIFCLLLHLLSLPYGNEKSQRMRKASGELRMALCFPPFICADTSKFTIFQWMAHTDKGIPNSTLWGTNKNQKQKDNSVQLGGAIWRGMLGESEGEMSMDTFVFIFFAYRYESLKNKEKILSKRITQDEGKERLPKRSRVCGNWMRTDWFQGGTPVQGTQCLLKAEQVTRSDTLKQHSAPAYSQQSRRDWLFKFQHKQYISPLLFIPDKYE